MVAAASNTKILRHFATATPGTGHALLAGAGIAIDGCGGKPSLHLTPRQREVLALLCEGLPNKLICRQLNIATGTVKIHISCILRELGVASRLQAVVAARRRGPLTKSPVRIPAESWDIAPATRPGMAAGASRCKVSRLDPVAF